MSASKTKTNNCFSLFRYQIKHSLVRHMRHECTQVSHFSCPDCSRTFTHGFNVIRHLQQVHKLSSHAAHQRYTKLQGVNSSWN